MIRSIKNKTENQGFIVLVATRYTEQQATELLQAYVNGRVSRTAVRDAHKKADELGVPRPGARMLYSWSVEGIPQMRPDLLAAPGPVSSISEAITREQERQRNQEMVRELAALQRTEAKRQQYIQTIRESLDAYEPSQIIPAAPYDPGVVEHAWVLQFSDWHVGQSTPIESTGGVYQQNTMITKSQVDQLLGAIEAVHAVQSQGQLIKKLLVLFLGDLVDGDAMRASQARKIDMLVTQQTVEVFDLVGYTLRRLLLLPGMESIEVHFVGGNHDRTSSKPGLAGLGELDYCVTTDTKVLTNDLRWVEAGSLSVGDKLLGFDENVSGDRASKGSKARRYVESIVTGYRKEIRKIVNLTLANGQVLRSTPEHRWLAKTSSGILQWVRAEDLTSKNYKLSRMVPFQESVNTYASDALSVMVREDVEIVSVENGGEAEIAVMETSSRTFIAGGFGAHNCDTYSWLVGALASRVFEHEPRVSIRNWDTFFGYTTFHKHRFIFEHGSSVRLSTGSYGGVPFYPITNGARKLMEHLGGADIVAMGHVHQPGILPIGQDAWLLMNGSLPATTQYVQSSMKAMRKPTQNLISVHEDHGMVQYHPLYAPPPSLRAPGSIWND